MPAPAASLSDNRGNELNKRQLTSGSKSLLRSSSSSGDNLESSPSRSASSKSRSSLPKIFGAAVPTFVRAAGAIILVSSE